ncbi:MAG: hypothetical protein ABI675_01040 [Chitinophagaceae bacterium]
MADILFQLKNVGQKTFFTDLQARKDEYISVLEEIYADGYTDRGKRFTKYFLPVKQNFSHFPSEIILPFGGNFIVECYDIREKLDLEVIQEEVLKILDDQKIRIYMKYILSNIRQIIKKIQSLKLNENLLPYQILIVEKLQTCIEHLKQTYLEVGQTDNNITPKLQWLGKTNVLTTLIYELWQGQEKGKQTSTKPLIKAQKKDLEALLINNFLDSKGKPLSFSTITHYLNTSKPETRAKKGVRIEL